ncbi:MAG TPA: helix-turn-helix domain-containing protein [Rhizomicrobium sp.]|nr:helix-turn-helix domain-containing protein [Rhizomicrobium sp.]
MTARRTAAAGVDYRLLAEFRFLQRQFLDFSERAARKAGLTPQQHQALLAIRGSDGPPPSVGYLADQLLIRHHSAVGLANRLVAAGLLKRVADAADRRRVTLAPTAKAEALLAKLSSAHRDELKRMAPTLRAILETL